MSERNESNRKLQEVEEERFDNVEDLETLSNLIQKADKEESRRLLQPSERIVQTINYYRAVFFGLLGLIPTIFLISWFAFKFQAGIEKSFERGATERAIMQKNLDSSMNHLSGEIRSLKTQLEDMQRKFLINNPDSIHDELIEIKSEIQLLKDGIKEGFRNSDIQYNELEREFFYDRRIDDDPKNRSN